jgi:hypothetical protein
MNPTPDAMFALAVVTVLAFPVLLTVDEQLSL